MRPSRFLSWQVFSFPIAYTVSNMYLNTDNYIGQINRVFGTNFNTNFNENGAIVITVFLILFLFPNLYVFTSLRSLKDDLLTNKVHPDASIIPHDDYIGISGKEYRLIRGPETTPFGFIMISLFPLILSYSSLVPVLAFLAIIILVGLSYPDTSFITMNPYLRLKYDVYMLRNGDKVLYVIMEKENEHEKPEFSNYVFDWFYDHTVLIGFKKEG
jgi:hypothetical protein